MMKTRTLFTILVVAAAASACNIEKPVVESTDAGEVVTLNATIGTPGTKIHFAQDMDTYTETRWEDGDCIWVRSDTQPEWERGDCFKTSADKISADGHSAAFTGRTRKDGKLCAVYPYGSVTPGSDNGTVLLDIPQSRTLAVGDCPAGSNAAAAFWADGSTSFSMKYLFGALKISITGNGQVIDSFEIEDAAGNVLWGVCKVTPDYDAGDIASIEMVNGSAKASTVELKAGPATLSSTPLDFYFILPEGSLGGGFTLKVIDTGENVLSFVSSNAGNAIVRGKVTKMPVVDISAAVPYGGVSLDNGTGTETDPYLIGTASDLMALSSLLADDGQYSQYADKWYVQTADIDMSGKAFAPIGSKTDKPFTGRYNGAGKKISNLSAQGASSDDPASGIFGYTSGAVISGIIAENRSNTGSFVRVGGIVGHAKNSTISSCTLTGGELAATDNICGGIAGQMDGGTIQGCTVSGAIVSSTKNYAAGIAGHVPSGGIIRNCKVTDGSTVKGAAEIGGIVGKIEGGTVEGCSVISSTVKGTGEDVGGITAWTKPSTEFLNCTVSATTIVTSSNYAAGIVALPEGASIAGCSVINGTTVNGASGIGGIAGYFKNTASTIDGCTINGISVTGTATNVGGVIGRFDLGVIKDTRITASAVKGIDSVGGVAGRPITRGGNCIIDNCFVSEGCSVSGTYYLGGIAGYVYPDSNYLLTIANCGVESCEVNSSAVWSTDNDSKCGGIVGWVRLTDANSNARILNCYAWSTVEAPLSFSCPTSTSTLSVGGIIGYASMNDSTPGTLLVAGCASNLGKADVNSGNVPDATEDARIGAIFGMVKDNGAAVLKNCYFVNDLGLTAGKAGSNVQTSEIEGFSGSEFKDGSTVVGKLNAFVAGYSDYTLKTWKTNASGLPVFE